MYQLDVVILPQAVDEAYFQNKIVVVVDVLRASTCIITAFAHGAGGLIALKEPDEVKKMAVQLWEQQPLLCGEREGVALPGFNLANSPSEYTQEQVAGKLLLYTSSNGSQLMVKARQAARTVIASFINQQAVVQLLRKAEESICIACSGREGAFSLEDTACAGMIVEGLKDTFPINDSAHMAHVLYQHHANDLHGLLVHSLHGKYLASLGLHEDLAFASQVDRYSVVPELIGDRFVVRHTE